MSECGRNEIDKENKSNSAKTREETRSDLSENWENERIPKWQPLEANEEKEIGLTTIMYQTHVQIIVTSIPLG